MHKNNFIIKTVPMPEYIKERLAEYIFDLCQAEEQRQPELAIREPAIEEDKLCKN